MNMSEAILTYKYPDGKITYAEDDRVYSLRLDDIDSETGRAGKVEGKQLPGIRLQVYDVDLLADEEARELFSDPETKAPPAHENPRFTRYILNEELDEHPRITFFGKETIDWYGEQIMVLPVLSEAFRKYSIKQTNDLIYEFGNLIECVMKECLSKMDAVEREGYEAEETALLEAAASLFLSREFSEQAVRHYEETLAAAAVLNELS